MSGEQQLRVGSWVFVSADCPMYCMVNSDDQVEVTFGAGTSVFDFLFTAESLRRFVRVGLAALREMDEIRTRENGPPV